MLGAGVVDSEWIHVVRASGGCPPPQLSFKGLMKTTRLYIEGSFKTMHPDVADMLARDVPRWASPRNAFSMLHCRPCPVQKYSQMHVCLHGTREDRNEAMAASKAKLEAERARSARARGAAASPAAVATAARDGGKPPLPKSSMARRGGGHPSARDGGKPPMSKLSLAHRDGRKPIGPTAMAACPGRQPLLLKPLGGESSRPAATSNALQYVQHWDSDDFWEELSRPRRAHEMASLPFLEKATFTTAVYK